MLSLTNPHRFFRYCAEPTTTLLMALFFAVTYGCCPWNLSLLQDISYWQWANQILMLFLAILIPAIIYSTLSITVTEKFIKICGPENPVAANAFGYVAPIIVISILCWRVLTHIFLGSILNATLLCEIAFLAPFLAYIWFQIMVLKRYVRISNQIPLSSKMGLPVVSWHDGKDYSWHLVLQNHLEIRVSLLFPRKRFQALLHRNLVNLDGSHSEMLHESD